MKRISIIIVLLFLFVFSLFAASPELTFNTIDNELEVLNFNEKNKPICEENIKFVNQTNSKLSFEVYGKKNQDSEKDFICSVTVKPNGSQSSSCKRGLEYYKYVYVICKNSTVTFSKITCQHDDMYFYIASASNVSMDTNEIDYSKYQKVVKHEGISKDSIYEGILQGCVKVFNKSSFVIEYKDKDTGVVKGKAQHTPTWVMSPTTYYFVFTFEAKDGRYRATFDDLEYDVGTKHVNRKTYGESEYNEMRQIFDDAINTINGCIKSSNSEEDDW